MIATNFWRRALVEKWQQLLMIVVVTTTLGACGPGLDSLAPYGIGGTVTGLTGTLVLQNNLGDNLSLSGDGGFKFKTELASDAAYMVTVLTQPSGQICTVSNGSGTATSEITNVSIQCGAPSTGTRQLGVAGLGTFGYSDATDASGNVYVAGYTFGGLDNNPLTGNTDFFVTKYNSKGVKQYTRQLGVAGSYTYGRSVATDSHGNVYVAGDTTDGLDGNSLMGNTDFFVTKYDSSGIKQYTRQLGVARADTDGISVATDASGNVYVAGDTSGGLDGNTLAGTSDFFVTKYDINGVKQYTRQLGLATAFTFGSSVTTDTSGNVYVAGYTSGGLDGNTLAGTTDVFVTKYNSSGERQYTRQLGVAGANTYGRSVATDAQGNVFVAGQTTGALPSNTRTGSADFFVAKYDSSGVLQYTRQLGAAGATTDALSVTTDASGSVFITGQTTGNLDGNSRMGTTDFFVIKYNNLGEKQYTQQLGVAGASIYGRSVATDASGNVFVAGETNGGLDGNTLTGTTDFFLTRFNNSLVNTPF